MSDVPIRCKIASRALPTSESVDQGVSYCIQNRCQGFGLNAAGNGKIFATGIRAAVEFDRAFA
ncbi:MULTISPECIES: hypothetical protein [unclassified Microcoleus]|uniref:hypothetical protein n=1 Tax=unclassified Microcoleus TaxID=2642155 RepID=UPI002FD187B4